MAYSERPTSVRRRLRKTTREIEKVLDDVATLYKPVEEWDWEELSRGRPRGEDGSFRGNRPKWITPVITAEAQRRMRTMTEQELMTYASQALHVLGELMTDDSVDLMGKHTVPPSVRADIGKYILNHILGTPRARLEVETGNPMAELMADVLVNPDGEPSHIVVEGSVVEDEDDGDDD